MLDDCLDGQLGLQLPWFTERKACPKGQFSKRTVSSFIAGHGGIGRIHINCEVAAVDVGESGRGTFNKDRET